MVDFEYLEREIDLRQRNRDARVITVATNFTEKEERFRFQANQIFEFWMTRLSFLDVPRTFVKLASYLDTRTELGLINLGKGQGVNKNDYYDFFVIPRSLEDVESSRNVATNKMVEMALSNKGQMPDLYVQTVLWKNYDERHRLECRIRPVLENSKVFIEKAHLYSPWNTPYFNIDNYDQKVVSVDLKWSERIKGKKQQGLARCRTEFAKAVTSLLHEEHLEQIKLKLRETS